MPSVLEAVVRIATAALAARPSDPTPRQAAPSPMLTVNQTAELMGMSRMTVIRKADAGELPCVVISSGARQKMRRFPRAAIEELAALGGSSPQIDLADYTARWLASAAARFAADDQ
jgi:excisionase family DNA binding protein